MNKEFRVYYGVEPATQEQLDAIEEIVVEQEIGRIWEARIKIPICMDEKGSWKGEDDPCYAEKSRVRIEARIGEGDFVPLIDGLIIRQDPGLSAYPGNSTLTLTVWDDSILIHCKSTTYSFIGKTDSDIASALFEDAGFGGKVDVEETGAPADPDAVVHHRGTPMQLLRSIMKRRPDFHAYVLPGEEVGKSDCYFKKLSGSPDSALPKLVLSGKERNMSGFNIKSMPTRAAVHEGAWLNMRDMSVTTAGSSSADVVPPEGENATQSDGSDICKKLIQPGIGDHIDLNDAADGAALASSFTIQADGEVLPMCYGAILSPYRMVSVQVSNSKFSGDYVIYKVTHTIGISEYTQSFSVRGNSVSPSSSAGASVPAAAAGFGGSISIDINIQIGIF